MPLAELTPLRADQSGRLAAVLHYCDEHGLAGDEPPWDDIDFRRHADGTVTVMGEAPDAIAMTFGILDLAGVRITWDGEALVLDVAPEPLRYRPVYADWLHRYVICRRSA